MIHISWTGFGNELTMGRVSALTNTKRTFLEKRCGKASKWNLPHQIGDKKENKMERIVTTLCT